MEGLVFDAVVFRDGALGGNQVVGTPTLPVEQSTDTFIAPVDTGRERKL